MDIKEIIKKIIKEDNLEMLYKYKNSTLSNAFISILQDELSSFPYDKDVDIDYLNRIVELLPFYINDNNVSDIDKKLKLIHQKIKTVLGQNPRFVDKKNHNYILFKDLIYDIEFIQMSIKYKDASKYQGSKYELLKYIIFESKKLPISHDLINSFPYMVNYSDKYGKKLIVSATDAYIEEVMNYKEGKGIDSIIYYDQIINDIMKSKEFIFNEDDKQKILEKISECIKKVDSEKEIKIFHLNSLTEKLNKTEIIHSNSFSEFKYNIPTEFNEAINSEVRKIVNSYTIGENRTEIDDYILSFDGEDTKEIDDALSIKMLDNGNIELGVHIADPLDVIDVDSIIFDEAIKRTSSIYLSDKTIPMYPKEISEDLISLKEKNYRPATSYYFEFDKYGNEVNLRILKTIIKVNRNMTYDDFNYISNMKSSDEMKKTIDNLSLVSNILKSYYNVDPLYEIVNRNTSNVSNTNIIGRSSGEKVVESSMVYTNYRIAKYCYDNGIPINYRNHFMDHEERDKYDYYKSRINDPNFKKFINMIKGMYPKAIYGMECYGHYGLQVPCYSHFTSPIRRCPDNGNTYSLDIHFREHDGNDIEKVKKLLLRISTSDNEKRDSKEQYQKEHEEYMRR